MLIPKENVKDLEEVPENVRSAITIIPAETVQTVLDAALCEKPNKTKAKQAKAAMPDVLPASGAENPAGLRA